MRNPIKKQFHLLSDAKHKLIRLGEDFTYLFNYDTEDSRIRGLRTVMDLHFKSLFQNVITLENYFNDLASKIPECDKPVEVGLCSIRNEEEDIRGWAKTMLFFCKEVFALVDPNTTDNTLKILKSEFPDVKVILQDRSLGDSDNDIKGPEEKLIMHGNLNKFISEEIDTSEWYLLFGADERFNPVEFPKIVEELAFARSKIYDALYWTNHNMHQFYPDDQHALLINPPDFRLRQFKFMKKKKHFYHNLKPHHGLKNPVQPQLSETQWFHYCFVKNSRKPFTYWRDQKRLKFFPTYPILNPIPDWRDLPMLNNKGEFL